MSSKIRKDIVDKILAIDEKLENHKILQLIFNVLAMIFYGLPLVMTIIIHMIYCKIVVKDNYRSPPKIVFAWFPIKTNSGYVWLKNVKRQVYCNSDMISYAQYRYTKI